jgi:hypothetical protein
MFPQFLAKLLPLHGKVNCRLHESQLIAHIVSFTAQNYAIYVTILSEMVQCVRQLKLPVYSFRSLADRRKYLTREYVPADHREVTRRFMAAWLFDKRPNLVKISLNFVPTDHTIAFDIGFGNLFQSDDRSMVRVVYIYSAA